MPASFASSVPECAFVCLTEYSAPSIHHFLHAASACSGASTLIQPRTPYEPATRPTSTRSSGRLLCKLLDQPRRRGRELRALAGPVLHALHVHAQRLAPRRRLGIVETEPLDELLARRASRIGHHHVEERPLVRAAPAQSDNHHDNRSLFRLRGRDYTGQALIYKRFCPTVIK